MRITLLPCSASPRRGAGWQHLTSYLINDTVVLDAGAVGLIDDLAAQSRVTNIVLSHSHIDHVATLPVFLDNTYKTAADCVTVHGALVTIESLKQDVFNGRVWPTYDEITAFDPPFLHVETLESGRCVEVQGLRFTPIAVDHAVPTLGFLVEEPGAAVAFSSDTAPTDELWRRANALPDLKAVFLEASFPDSLASVAAAAKHLTPVLFGREVAKLRLPVTVVAIHIKPGFFTQVTRELAALGLPNLEIGEAGRTYRF